MDLLPVHACFLQASLHGRHGLEEEIIVQLLEARPGQGTREIDALEELVDLDDGLRR